jgi:hypothetical protein
MTFNVGVTGTRRGMINPQRVEFRRFLSTLTVDQFHHGDCVGTDEEAHQYCRELQPNARIYVHPPKDPKLRAWCHGDIILPEEDYLARNLNIVAVSNILIACPKMMTEEFRGSGTWHAIRAARRMKTNVVIIYPSGRTETVG